MELSGYFTLILIQDVGRVEVVSNTLFFFMAASIIQSRCGACESLAIFPSEFHLLSYQFHIFTFSGRSSPEKFFFFSLYSFTL